MNVNKIKKRIPCHSVSEAYDRFKEDNPLMMRKKFQMKDVYFHRDQPDRELVRWELAFDVELYVILIALVVGTVCLFCKITGALERGRIRRMEKRLLKRKR